MKSAEVKLEIQEHKRRMRDIYEKYGNQKAATSNYSAGASLISKQENQLPFSLSWQPSKVESFWLFEFFVRTGIMLQSKVPKRFQ